MKPLRIFAVLFGLLALWNLQEPFGLLADSDFMFLGKRLLGAPNLIAAWSFAVFLACYAAALWRQSAAALPLGIAYAAYLHVNLHYALLFTFRDGEAPFDNARGFAIYTAIALCTAWGAVATAVYRRLAGPDRSLARILLRSFALLFALMALSNALKPFAYAPDVGFIFFGHRLAGTTNTIVALIFSTLLAVYAAGIWAEKRWALPLGAAYALYVVTNIVLWNKHGPKQADAPFIFILPYLLGAIGVSSGAALLLWQRRDRLV